MKAIIKDKEEVTITNKEGISNSRTILSKDSRNNSKEIHQMIIMANRFHNSISNLLKISKWVETEVQ